MLFERLEFHNLNKKITVTHDQPSGLVRIDIDHGNGITSHSIEKLYGACEFIKREVDGDEALAHRLYDRLEPFFRSF